MKAVTESPLNTYIASWVGKHERTVAPQLLFVGDTSSPTLSNIISECSDAFSLNVIWLVAASMSSADLIVAAGNTGIRRNTRSVAVIADIDKLNETAMKLFSPLMLRNGSLSIFATIKTTNIYKWPHAHLFDAIVSFGENGTYNILPIDRNKKRADEFYNVIGESLRSMQAILDTYSSDPDVVAALSDPKVAGEISSLKLMLADEKDVHEENPANRQIVGKTEHFEKPVQPSDGHLQGSRKKTVLSGMTLKDLGSDLVNTPVTTLAWNGIQLAILYYVVFPVVVAIVIGIFVLFVVYSQPKESDQPYWQGVYKQECAQYHKYCDMIKPQTNK